MPETAQDTADMSVLSFEDGSRWNEVKTPEEFTVIKERIEGSLSRPDDVSAYATTGAKQEIPMLEDLVPEFYEDPNQRMPAAMIGTTPAFGVIPEFFFEDNDRKAVFVLEDAEGSPKALVQLHGIYINEIAVDYSPEIEFSMSALRGEIGARLLINRDARKPIDRDGRYKAVLPGRDGNASVIMQIKGGRLHGGEGESAFSGKGAAYRLETEGGVIQQAYFFKDGVLERAEGPAVIRRDQEYVEYHADGVLYAASHSEKDYRNWTMHFENRLLSRDDGPAYEDDAQVTVEAWAKGGRAHRDGGEPSFIVDGQPRSFHRNGVRTDDGLDFGVPEFTENLYVREDGTRLMDAHPGEFAADDENTEFETSEETLESSTPQKSTGRRV